MMDPEADAALARYYRRDWWEALGILWTERRGDLEGTFYPVHVRFGLRLLCTIAMILHRGPADSIYGMRDGIDMGYWDYNELYAGWECKTLHFDPKTVRYELSSDGDWNM